MKTADGNWLFGWNMPESAFYSPVSSNAWSQITLTRSGDSYQLWVNGQNIGDETSNADISDADNTNPFRIGSGSAGGTPSNYFDGQIDELDIFDRAVRRGGSAALRRRLWLLRRPVGTYQQRTAGRIPLRRRRDGLFGQRRRRRGK